LLGKAVANDGPTLRELLKRAQKYKGRAITKKDVAIMKGNRGLISRDDLRSKLLSSLGDDASKPIVNKLKGVGIRKDKDIIEGRRSGTIKGMYISTEVASKGKRRRSSQSELDDDALTKRQRLEELKNSKESSEINYDHKDDENEDEEEDDDKNQKALEDIMKRFDS